MQPSEYWDLSNEEFWKLYDVRRTDARRGSSLSDKELAELYELL